MQPNQRMLPVIVLPRTKPSFHTMAVGVMAFLVLVNIVDFSFIKSSLSWGEDGGMLWSSSSSSSYAQIDEKLFHEKLQQMSVGAQAFLDQHKLRYLKENRLQWWQIRHLGYLYEEHNLLLAGVVPEEITDRVGRQVVRIYNVWNTNYAHEGVLSSHSATINQQINKTQCDKLTLWVRVNGPELFAGSAVAVPATSSSRDCHWEFPFDLEVPGSYQVEVKVLVWDSPPNLRHGACQDSESLDAQQRESLRTNNTVQFKKIKEGLLSLDDYDHVGFVGFKLYYPTADCCAICNRLRPWCAYWITPALNIENPSKFRTGCELVFRRDTPSKFLLQSHLIKPSEIMLRYPALMNSSTFEVHIGSSSSFFQAEPVGYFVGCGWSPWTLDFPCLNGNDDHIYMWSNNFTLQTPEVSNQTLTTKQPPEETANLPLCQIEDEVQFIRDNDDVNGTSATTYGSSSSMPKGRWVREEWPHDCGPFKLDPNFTSMFRLTEFIGSLPHCWHRDDFSIVGDKCVELNCRLIDKASRWKSTVHGETNWMGVWRNYNCDYLEFTDQQLQQCLSNRKISSFQIKGKSIAAYLQQYLNSRLAAIRLTPRDDPDSVDVIFTTLSSFHRGRESNLTAHLQGPGYPSANNRTLIYWVTSAYLSSEREVNMYVGRPEAMDRLSYHVMKKRGYHMIDMHDMTPAFTYDTATQYDGMHIIGPPMKMAITKLFHYICKDEVDGSRV